MSKIENKINFGTNNKIINSPVTQGSNRVKNNVKDESVTRLGDASSDRWHQTWWGVLALTVIAGVIIVLITS